MKTQLTRSPTARRERGMSLLELTLVIVLIGGILTLVASKIFGAKDRADYKMAEIQLKTTLAQKIEDYHTDVGAYPDSFEQLLVAPSDASGWLGPYAKATDFKDPWQNLIQYQMPGDNDAPFKLLSLGADGKPGGEGVDKDLVAP